MEDKSHVWKRLESESFPRNCSEFTLLERKLMESTYLFTKGHNSSGTDTIEKPPISAVIN
jgi:hypothetical protein